MSTLNKDNMVLFIKTIQTGPFKTLIGALKDILIDCNVIFTPAGVKVVNMDKTQTVVVYLDLPHDKFECYECKRDRIIICMNLHNFSKILTTLDSTDTLNMYIDNNNYDDGFVSYFSIAVENAQINQLWIMHLRVMDPESEESIYPDMEFSSVITMPSADFQKIIRAYHILSTDVEIKIVGNEINFSCTGQIADSGITRTSLGGEKSSSDKVVQGCFPLRALSNFIKCTPLSPQIDIYLANDLPLVTKYAVANLGTLRLCLAAKQAPAEYNDK